MAVGVPALLYAGICLYRYDGGGILRGDGEYYAAVVRSLYQDQDLDLGNQFHMPDPTHRGQLSMAQDGRFVPKHPVLMPIVAAPFLLVAEVKGALVFNLLQLLALLAVLYGLCRRFAGRWQAAAAVAATGTLSLLPHYVWNWSPDVFATLWLASALLALPAAGRGAPPWRDFLAGVLLGFAIWAKTSMFLFVPGVLLLIWPPRLGRVHWLAVGAALPLALFAWFNWHFFGSPLVTSYHRIAWFHHGDWLTVSQQGDFRSPFGLGFVEQMTDPKLGLLHTSLVTVVSWLGFFWMWRRRPGDRHDRLVAIYLFTGFVALYMFFASYLWWRASHHGNRFLMPIVALSAVPLAAMLSGITSRWRSG